MKKSLLFFVLLGIVVFGLSAQERFPDLKRYFILIQQLDSPNWDFSRNPFYGETPAVHTLFSNLTGKLDVLDSYLEMALITYYSAAERPWAERGNSVLPLNNPRLVDRQLGAHVYKDLVIYRFLNDTQAVSRHEAMLKFITDRRNVTRAEVETFYRNGIRDLIAEIVDEEFNKVSFIIEVIINQQARSYGSVLTHNPQNGEYILSYERPSIQNSRKTLSASSLEALSSAMSRNSAEFNQNGINTVRAQAALIPAVVFPTAVRDDLINLITSFYLNPNRNTAGALQSEYGNLIRGSNQDSALADSFINALYILNPALVNIVDN